MWLKLKTLTWGDYPGRPNLITWILKKQKDENWEGFELPLLALKKDKEVHKWSNEVAFKRTDLQFIASKKTEALDPQWQG